MSSEDVDCMMEQQERDPFSRRFLQAGMRRLSCHSAKSPECGQNDARRIDGEDLDLLSIRIPLNAKMSDRVLD